MNSNEERGCWKGRGGKKRFFLFPLAIVGFVAVKSAVVMVLWNYLIPDLFHGPELAYLQALGLTVLAKVLIGGGPGRGFGRGGGPGGWRRGPWKDLSPEDREKLREKMRQRFSETE